jgi:hypothetical protein
MEQLLAEYLTVIDAQVRGSNSGVTRGEMISLLTLARLDIISQQLFNQGYHAGFTEPVVKTEVVAARNLEAPAARTWRSPASSQAAWDQ